MKLALRQLGHQAWVSIPSIQRASNHITATSVRQTVVSWLETASQFLVKRLFADAEPQVWYTSDADGNLWWHAHDALMGRSIHDLSEAEMRVWLEQCRSPIAL